MVSKKNPAVDSHKKMGLDILPFRLLVRHSSPAERSRLNQSLYESGSLEASRLLHESLRAREEPVRLFAAQALELISARHFAAIEALHAVLKKNPEDAGALTAIADRLMEYAEECVSADTVRRHFYTEAAGHLTKALAKSPDAPELLLRMGRLQFLLGDYESAKPLLEKVPRARAEYSLARWTLAEIALAEGRINDVQAECQALSAFPIPAELREAVRHWSEP
jgi:tetratricopeptide (TPR) repeat protein